MNFKKIFSGGTMLELKENNPIRFSFPPSKNLDTLVFIMDDLILKTVENIYDKEVNTENIKYTHSLLTFFKTIHGHLGFFHNERLTIIIIKKAKQIIESENIISDKTYFLRILTNSLMCSSIKNDMLLSNSIESC